MTQIGIPNDWDNNHLILFEEFCELIRNPEPSIRDWRRHGTRPDWARVRGLGRLHITVARARRFLATATRTEARTEMNRGAGTDD